MFEDTIELKCFIFNGDWFNHFFLRHSGDLFFSFLFDVDPSNDRLDGRDKLLSIGIC